MVDSEHLLDLLTILRRIWQKARNWVAVCRCRQGRGRLHTIHSRPRPCMTSGAALTCRSYPIPQTANRTIAIAVPCLDVPLFSSSILLFHQGRSSLLNSQQCRNHLTSAPSLSSHSLTPPSSSPALSPVSHSRIVPTSPPSSPTSTAKPPHRDPKHPVLPSVACR